MIDSQNRKIIKALKAGRKLTAMSIIRLTGSSAPATRMSEVGRWVTLQKRWIKSNGKRFMEYSL
jgi:hypothetical protein